MDISLAQIEEIPILKDITFWHFLGTGAVGLLIKMFNKHMDKTEQTLKQTTEILNSLVTKTGILEVKSEDHDRRIVRLEDGE